MMRPVARGDGLFWKWEGWGGGTRGTSDYPSEPDPGSLRTVRVTEAPQPREVGGAGLVLELSQMFGVAPDVPRGRDRTLLLPTPSPDLRSVNKLSALPAPCRFWKPVSKGDLAPTL